MAIQFQNGFSADMINTPIISALGMVKKDNALGYYKAFSDLASDSVVAELEASGAVRRVGGEVYKMYFQNAKDRNSFKVTADVEVADSAPVTVTIDTYADDGNTLSVPSEGLFLKEDSTGIEFQVMSVDKDTAGQHTAVIKPTSSGVTATIPSADAHFYSIGRPTVQEASFQQAGEHKAWGERDNSIRIIRTNKAWSDLATMIKVEQVEGKTYYDLDSTEMPKEHIDVKEMELMMGEARDNVDSEGNRNVQGSGFIPLVKAYGTSIDGGGSGEVLDRALFRQIARSINGNGLSQSYRGLADGEAIWKIQDFLLANNVPDQTAVARENEMIALFDYKTNFQIDGISYSFKNYNYWNSGRLSGGDVTKSHLSNQILLMPNGGFTNPEGIFQPYMQLRYLDNDITSDEGTFNKIDRGGALFGHGTTRSGEVSMTSYMGADIAGVEGFIYLKLAND